MKDTSAKVSFVAPFRLPGAGLFRRTRAARSSQMRLVRVVGDSLPIATESRVEIWNARRRDTRFSSGIYSCVYVPRDALILSLSLSFIYARARAHVFVSSPFLSLSVSLPFSQAARHLLFLPLFAPLPAPSGIRMYECTLARLSPCLFLSMRPRLSYSLSLSLLFPPLARVRVEAMPPVRRALLPSLRPSSPRRVPPELQLSVPQRFSTASYATTTATNGTEVEARYRLRRFSGVSQRRKGRYIHLL